MHIHTKALDSKNSPLFRGIPLPTHIIFIVNSHHVTYCWKLQTSCNKMVKGTQVKVQFKEGQMSFLL